MSGFSGRLRASWISRFRPIRTRSATSVRAFLADRSPSAYVRAMADDERGLHRRALARARGARLDRRPRPRGAGRPRARPRRRGGGARGDGPRPVPRPVLLVRDRRRRSRRAGSARSSCSNRSPTGRAAARSRSRSSGHGDPVDRDPHPRPAQGRRLGAHRAEAARARRSHRRLGDRRGAHARRGSGRSSSRTPAADAVPTMDPTRKAARLVLDETPAIPIGPLGDHTAIWRRVADDSAVGARGRARRRVRGRDGDGGRVLEGPRAVRQADRDAPGDPAQDRRHAAPARARSGRRALRGLGVRRGRRAPRPRRGDREELDGRGRGVRDRREHPGARRGRLHLGHATRSFFYKRAKQNDTLLGYQGWQRQRIADLVLDAA